jgi:hypothetical protein
MFMIHYSDYLIHYQEVSITKPEDIYQCQTVNCGYFYNPDKGDRK